MRLGRRKSSYALAVVFLLAICLSPIRKTNAEQVQSAHNGFWWLNESSGFKTGYCLGYIEGAHSTSFIWQSAATHISKQEIHSANETSQFNNIKVGQLSDGLDAFYVDFRNKSIHVEDAIGYVRGQLRGWSEQELSSDLQQMRKLALEPGYN